MIRLLIAVWRSRIGSWLLESRIQLDVEDADIFIYMVINIYQGRIDQSPRATASRGRKRR